MASNATVEIVISARDQFSPAFGQLDEAFAQAERSGGGMRGALKLLDEVLTLVTQGAEAAGDATSEYAERAEASLIALGQLRAELEQQHAVLSEELAGEHGERLLSIEQETQQALTEAAGEGMQQRVELDEQFWEEWEKFLQEKRKSDLVRELDLLKSRLEAYRSFYERMAELAEGQGRAMAGVSKSLAIAIALIDTYRAANAALATVPFPLNFAAAALVLAEGLANVQRIRQVSVAHGGLEEVPEDSTFLLRRGERVIAPRQNEELESFLRREREGARAAAVIENLEIHILENATAGQTLLAMGPAEWRQVVAEKVIPALNELAGLGIHPAFVGGTT